MPFIALLLLLGLSSAPQASTTLSGCERDGEIVYSRECLELPSAPAPVTTAHAAEEPPRAPAADAPEPSMSRPPPSRPPSPWAVGNSSACASTALVDQFRQGARVQLADCALTPDVVAEPTAGGRTLLHWAVAAGQPEAATALVEAGAPLGATSRRDRGGQPLHLAAKSGNRALVELLLEAGAPLEGRDLFGYTPLHQAAAAGHTAIVAALLKAGAPLEARDRTDGTPLLIAALYGRAATLTPLLDAGADAAARDRRGQTALDYAAGQSALLKPLLAAGIGQKAPAVLSRLVREGIDAHWSSITLLLDQEPRFSATAGRELLRLSLEQQHLPFFRRLLTLGVDPGQLNLAEFRGRSDFIHAILQAGLLHPRETEAAQRNPSHNDERG